MTLRAAAQSLPLAFVALTIATVGPAAAQVQQADPFLWLEPQHDPRAVDWAREQTARTEHRLAAGSTLTAVTAETAAAQAASVPLPGLFLLGGVDELVDAARGD
jgi:hypothetical protein